MADSFTEKMNHIRADFDKQNNAVHDYDELLKEIDLHECCELIKFNGHLGEELHEMRKQVTDLDS